MRRTKFYSEMPIEDKFAIFNTITRDIIFVDKDYRDMINTLNLSEEEIIYLKDRHILVENDMDDENIFNNIRNKVNSLDTSIDLVYVIPTLNCNLRCSYCYIYNNNYKKGSSMVYNMTEDVVDIFLDKYGSYLKSKNIQYPCIQFYGGEPLCNWKIVKYFIEKAKLLYNFDVNIITNGTLLSEDKLKFIKEYDVGLGISLDGNETITNRYRKAKDGNRNIYSEIVSNLSKVDSDCRVALSLTISKDIIDDRDDVLSNLSKLNVKNTNYNLLHTHVYDPDLEKYYVDATKYLIDSYNTLYKKGICDDRISIKIEAFVKGNFYYCDCSASTSNQIVLLPNGDISICQGELENRNSVINNIFKDSFDEIVNNDSRRKWREYLPINNSKCRNCDYISLCGGGCILHAMEINEYDGIDKAFCNHTKVIFEWLLGKLYESQNDSKGGEGNEK